MNNVILRTLGGALINALTTMFPKQVVKEMLDDLLDIAEDRIQKSENKIDDVTAGALIAYFRVVFDIPDNIGGDED